MDVGGAPLDWPWGATKTQKLAVVVCFHALVGEGVVGGAVGP